MKKKIVISCLIVFIACGLGVLADNSDDNSQVFKVQMSSDNNNLNGNKTEQNEEFNYYNNEKMDLENSSKEFSKSNMKNPPRDRNYNDFANGNKEKVFSDKQKGVRPDKMEKPQGFPDNSGKSPDKRPKYKPDAQPGGKLMPKEWDT